MALLQPPSIITSLRDDPSQTQDRALARRALVRLSEVQRVVLEGGYFEGLSYREMAQRCAIPEGTVKSRLAAALVKLRQDLNSAGGID